MAKTLDDLAWEALFEAMILNIDKEHLGAILPDGTYTEPQNTRVSGTRKRARAEVPANLRALYHNHPPGEGNEEFSRTDRVIANSLGVPSYIAAPEEGGTPSGASIHRFDPGETEGRPVLAQFPIEAWHRYIDKLLEQ